MWGQLNLAFLHMNILGQHLVVWALGKFREFKNTRLNILSIVLCPERTGFSNQESKVSELCWSDPSSFPMCRVDIVIRNKDIDVDIPAGLWILHRKLRPVNQITHFYKSNTAFMIQVPKKEVLCVFFQSSRYKEKWFLVSWKQIWPIFPVWQLKRSVSA